MDIEAIVKKYGCGQFGIEEVVRAALTELAAGYEQDLRIYLARAETSEADYARAVERLRQLEAELAPDGWNGWRDVAVHGYPEAAQEVLFVHKGKTVHGAFIGEIFWHSNEKCVAALWRPLPTPLNHDEWRSLLAAPQPKKEGE